jgi:hypothetical protein
MSINHCRKRAGAGRDNQVSENYAAVRTDGRAIVYRAGIGNVKNFYAVSAAGFGDLHTLVRATCVSQMNCCIVVGLWQALQELREVREREMIPSAMCGLGPLRVASTSSS